MITQQVGPQTEAIMLSDLANIHQGQISLKLSNLDAHVHVCEF